MGKSFIISTKNQQFSANKIAKLKNNLGIGATDYSDFLEIAPPEGHKTLGIDTMKGLKRWSQLKPYSALNRLGVIYEAEVLTPEAQNSILKLLEEPHDFLSLVLVSSDYKQLLQTVISRCEIIEDKTIYVAEAYQDSFTDKSFLEKFAQINQLLAIKDKQEQRRAVTLFLTRLTVENRERLLYDNNNKFRYLKLYELIKLTKGMLDSNVTVKLALENLVINFEENA